MSPRNPPSAEVIAQAARVKAAFLDAAERGISRRQIAVAALGENASKTRIENMKNQIVKWIGAYNGPSDESARVLARGFARVGLPEYDAAYFKKDRGESAPPLITRDEYHAEMKRLRDEQEKARKKEEQRYKRLQAEIRKLRKEAS